MDAKLYNDMFIGWTLVPANASFFWRDNFPRDLNLPRDIDLHWAVWCGLAITFTRYLVEKYIFTPIGRIFKLPEKKPKLVERNHTLKKFFKKESRPSSSEIVCLAKEIGWQQHKVTRWFHLQRCNERASRMTKFTECLWKLVFITFLWSFAVYSIHGLADWENPIFTLNVMRSVPLNRGVFRVFMVIAGWYVSLSLTMLVDVRRKDFYVMACHHAVTFVLIYTAYMLNALIFGIQVVVIHDFGDILMESAKALRYVRCYVPSVLIFGTFTITWLLLRIMYFGSVFVVLPIFDSTMWMNGAQFGCLLVGLCLSSLLALHVYWFAIIVRISTDGLIDMFTNKSSEKGVDDTRSEVDSDSEAETTTTTTTSRANRRSSYYN